MDMIKMNIIKMGNTKMAHGFNIYGVLFSILILIGLSGCAGKTKQYVEMPSEVLKEDKTRILLNRPNEVFGGTCARYKVSDNGKSIGYLTKGGRLIWDRDQSDLQIIATTDAQCSSGNYFSIKRTNLEASHGYRFHMNWKKGIYFVGEGKYKE